MNPQVVVVGSFVQDLTFVTDHLPSAGETTLGRFITGPGGKGSNQAVASARAGVATRFVGAVGNDAWADGAVAFHRAEGIDSKLIRRSPHPTAAAGIIVDGSGQNQIVVAIGASAQLRRRDVPTPLFAGAQVIVAQHEANLSTDLDVFRRARKAGLTTVLNPAPMRDDFDPEILRHVLVLIPNESEFEMMAELLEIGGTQMPKNAAKADRPSATATAAALLDLSPNGKLQERCRRFAVPTMIVTLGKRGCFLSTAARGFHLPAHRMKAIDTTGAGDAFVGAFAAGLVKFGGDTLQAARFGNAAAALSVTRFGAAQSMPCAREIAQLLRKSKSA
jgi:ribokinase